MDVGEVEDFDCLSLGLFGVGVLLAKGCLTGGFELSRLNLPCCKRCWFANGANLPWSMREGDETDGIPVPGDGDGCTGGDGEETSGLTTGDNSCLPTTSKSLSMCCEVGVVLTS